MKQHFLYRMKNFQVRIQPVISALKLEYQLSLFLDSSIFYAAGNSGIRMMKPKQIYQM